MNFQSILFLILLLIPTVTLAQQKAPTHFNWGDDYDFPPFIYFNDNKNPAGIFEVLMTKIFSELDVTLNISLYPWKRVQKMMNEGTIDGYIAFPTAKRLETLHQSEPLFNVDLHLFYLQTNPQQKKIAAIKTVAELSNFLVVSYNGDGWSEQHLNKDRLIIAPNYASALKMFAKGRADIFIDNGVTMKYYMDILEQQNPEIKSSFSQVRKSTIILDSNPFCLLLDKKKFSTQFMTKLNAQVKKLKATGFVSRTLTMEN